MQGLGYVAYFCILFGNKTANGKQKVKKKER